MLPSRNDRAGLMFDAVRSAGSFLGAAVVCIDQSISPKTHELPWSLRLWMAMSFICSFVRLQMHLQHRKIAGKNRFKYLLKTERAKDYSIALKSQYSKKIFSRQEVEQFLKLEGFSLLQNQLTTWAMKLFKETEKQVYTEKQVIALIGRLSVDEEVESQFRNIFQYFSPVNGKITAKQLRRGLHKLGENVKEREADRILLEMDMNGLGYIQFEDFLEAMMA